MQREPAGSAGREQRIDVPLSGKGQLGIDRDQRDFVVRTQRQCGLGRHVASTVDENLLTAMELRVAQRVVQLHRVLQLAGHPRLSRIAGLADAEQDTPGPVLCSLAADREVASGRLDVDDLLVLAARYLRYLTFKHQV